MAAVASIFVASPVSTITISGPEQSDFFSNEVDPSDYSITLGFDLNRYFNALTLGPLPITDDQPAVGEEDLPQGLSADTGSTDDAWYTRLETLKRTNGGGASGWGDMKDNDPDNLEATTQMIVFKKRMEHVLNSLFGTSTAANSRPLKEDKIKGWLEETGRFEAAVFTQSQFSFLRAMFVHAEKYDAVTHKLKLLVGDKMGVVVQISTTEPGAAVNMITVNLFIEQELDEVLAASDAATAAATAATGAATKAAAAETASVASGTVSSVYDLTAAAIQYLADASNAYTDAGDVTSLMQRYVAIKQGFIGAAANSVTAAQASVDEARVSLSELAAFQANEYLALVEGYKTQAQTAESAVGSASDLTVASTNATLAAAHATNAETNALIVRQISDQAVELAPGLTATDAATASAVSAEAAASAARAAADAVNGYII